MLEESRYNAALLPTILQFVWIIMEIIILNRPERFQKGYKQILLRILHLVQRQH